MKIKYQFIILSSLITTIPILCSIFVLIHTYMHSPNRYLMDGSEELQSQYFSNIPEEDRINLKKSLKLLPVNVEAILLQISNRKVLYSTMDEIQADEFMQKGEIWNFASETSDKYFYQFTSIPSKESDTLLITRVPQKNVSNEKRIRTILKVLMIVIFLTAVSLALITIISRNIFNSLNKIEKSSSQLAEGKLDKPITNDISAARQNEFSTIMHSLEKMRCELIEMQASKNRFMMGISHDLRTPVAVIKGYTEAMSEGFYNTPEEAKKSLEIISTKTEQLETMINTLINFVKLNQTDWVQQLKKQKIAPVFEEFAKSSVTTGGIFKRNVTTNIQISGEIEIPFDKELVQRTLENLFSNALRYTSENDSIQISAVQEDNKIFFSIKDSGIGIKSEDLEKIFDMFYRSSSSRREEGMGIGLATVMTIVKAHGWKISVNSEFGKGSEFKIEIPCANS